MEIIFDSKDVCCVNLKKAIIRDANGLSHHVPQLFMPSDWRQIRKGKTYDDVIFSYRYCAQYESMFCNCVDDDMKRIRGRGNVSYVPKIYWTYDESFNITKVCLLHNGFYTAIAKLTNHSDSQYIVQGFSYQEPYYGTYCKKIRFEDNKCIINFRPLKPNSHGYYGSYLTHDIPLFNNKEAAEIYVEWLKDNVLISLEQK